MFIEFTSDMYTCIKKIIKENFNKHNIIYLNNEPINTNNIWKNTLVLKNVFTIYQFFNFLHKFLSTLSLELRPKPRDNLECLKIEEKQHYGTNH